MSSYYNLKQKLITNSIEILQYISENEISIRDNADIIFTILTTDNTLIASFRNCITDPDFVKFNINNNLYHIIKDIPSKNLFLSYLHEITEAEINELLSLLINISNDNI